MAREAVNLLSPSPTAIASADVRIGHVQLRDLIVCPRKRGVVNYVKQNAIVEHDITNTDSNVKTLVDLPFTPNTLTSMVIPGTEDTLLAAGGQDAEIHLSCSSPSSSRHGLSQVKWQHNSRLAGSINNSLLLTSLSMTPSHQSSVEPRVAISNNDGTVRFFDIPIRTKHFSTLPEVGCIRLNVPINHSSISPDGRTLLSVGDSYKVFLHRLTGGSRINLSPIATLTLPAPDIPVLPYASTALVASFSTSFSSDGTKYAVASQEGVVVVWDVRSTKPLKSFQTDKLRTPLSSGGALGWLSDPWEWTQGTSRAPGWSVRSVKFSSGGNNRFGKEVMAFTEHTSLLHIIDARTFETEEIVQVPHVPRQTSSSQSPRRETHERTRHPRLSPTGLVTPSTLPSYIFSAMEDTPRIPSVIPRQRSTSTDAGNDNEPDDFVMIPPLGDLGMENDVQALLAGHGIRSRARHRRSYGYESPAPDAMDDIDCVSHVPSRSSSPHRHAPSPPSRASPPTRSNSRAYIQNQDDGLDIAGLCFDPSGAYVYAATTESVVEWRISGAEKRWWTEDGWV